MVKKYDAVIIGSGPNGLSAGIVLAREGLRVLIVEARSSAGGGTRTSSALTLDGFAHDVCAAVHPMGALSPFFRALQLEKYGLEWIHPKVSVAHPLEGQEPVILSRSVEETADGLGVDARRYRRLMSPFADRMADLLDDAMKPLGMPKYPLLFARFGLHAVQPALGFAHRTFKGERAKALFAGCAAHSVLPLDKFFTTAMGLVFLGSAHAVDWPVARGGSQAIADALLRWYTENGGEIVYDTLVTDLKQLPDARAYLFDTDPAQLVTIAGDHLPAGYVRRLQRFAYGPGVFKMDFALRGPIPWLDPRCADASTVHLGGTLGDIATGEREAWEGTLPQRPFVLVAQQSLIDPTRAPAGQHTGWAYCHVPHGSTADASAIIMDQIERAAPGFRELILAQHAMNTGAFHHYNPNYLGGAVTGGAADITQLFTRPVARWDPYTTPDPRIFICSASTPPGGGVHGMCGYHAARSVLRHLRR